MRSLLLLTMAALGLSAAVAAGAPAPASKGPATRGAPAVSADDPRAVILSRIPGVKAEELRPSAIPGLWEVARGAEVTYVSADGRYILAGDIYQVAQQGEYPNLSDQRRRELRRELVAKELTDARTIVFAPKNPKHVVTVFTDPDCTWCRKLHSQIAEYNKLGIAVHYAFFPREGPDSEVWRKSEAVWCSADRRDALTRAKRGETIKSRDCGNTPVRATWSLGREIGIQGTPGLVLADGELVPGYLPPQQLLEHLKKSAATAQAAAVR